MTWAATGLDRSAASCGWSEKSIVGGNHIAARSWLKKQQKLKRSRRA